MVTRLPLVILCIALAASPIRSVVGQALPPCPWERCALREQYGLFSARLVEGREERRVATFSFFAPGVPLFAQRSDSAAQYYASFRNRANSGTALSLVGTAMMVAALFTLDWDNSGDDALAGGLMLGGLGLTIGGVVQMTRARNQLSRAVWHYNGTLDRQP